MTFYFVKAEMDITVNDFYLLYWSDHEFIQELGKKQEFTGTITHLLSNKSLFEKCLIEEICQEILLVLFLNCGCKFFGILKKFNTF
jgi:hypothetical protein